MKNYGTIIDRKNPALDPYRDILDRESHHEHHIVRDSIGVLRWLENGQVNAFLNRISLNDLCPMLMAMGYGKNSEVYRKMYRDMGYSLSGYAEIFYSDEESENYVANPAGLPVT